MIQLSLTEFVDIVSASGTPKATKIRNIKYRLDYDPVIDFYKKIRDIIVETHQSNLTKSTIDKALQGLTDRKKINAYPDIVAGYKKWWGHKSITWFEPPNMHYLNFNINISINPELGLYIDGIPYLIKLYFKGESLVKNRADIITHLMAITTAQHCPSPDTQMSVLDVRRSRLIKPTVPINGLTAMLDAELSYVTTLWPSV